MGLLEQVTLSGTDSKDKNISKYFYNNAGLQIKMYTGMSSENDTSYLTTNYEYDSWLRAVRTTDSTGYNSGTITYDLNGNVLTNTDANDNITTNTYDALNHVLTSKTVNSKDYKKNVSKSYEYDNMGRILRAVTNDLTTYYAYDDLGRKTEEVEGKDGYSTFKGFFYEGVSQYTRQQIVGINNLLMYSYTSYEYDGEMRLTKVKETGEETVSYTYDRNGNKKSETLANGVVSTYDYNNANRIVKLVNKKGNSTISSYEYSYYLDGSDACKKTTENGIIETTEYEYDGLKRLTNEAVKKGSNTDTYSYEYDDYGNRSKMTATGTEDYVTEYNYNNAQGKYTALLQKEVKTVEKESNPLDLNSNVKQTVYTYDANGNQIKKTAEGKTETNTYNGLNQLIGFTDGETTASYKYNASGLRYEKTVNGETINHVWDGNKQIVADVIDNQFYEADCYIRGTNLVAKYNYWNGDKSEYTYYTQNAHGDVVNLTDKDGKVTKSYRYDAFGVEKDIDDSDTNAFRYCGEYYDKETASVYLRARNYNPSTGRFISRDSYAGKNEEPLSLNKYTYCHNNPLIYFDPTGNVISLSGLPQQQEDTLSYLQQLTDYPLAIDDDGNVSINKDVILAVRYESGNELLERLINSSHVINIEVIDGNDGNAYSTDNYDNSINPDIGSGGTVYFNPMKDIQIKTVNSNSGYVSMKKRPSYIGLGHELIHADRAARGVNLGSHKISYFYKSRMDRDKTVFSEIISTLLKTTSVREARSAKEEVATVGLRYNKKDDITENDLRWEHRLELRGAY